MKPDFVSGWDGNSRIASATITRTLTAWTVSQHGQSHNMMDKYKVDTHNMDTHNSDTLITWTIS